MKIVELKAESIQRLKAIEIRPGDEPMVKVTGKNEAGKSSVLDSILMAMGGDKVQSVEPIHRGEEKGKIVLDLGKYKVIRGFTAKGQSLRVESQDGAYYKSPQTLINKWKSDISFDPKAFAEADSRKQREMLLSAINLKVDLKHLALISGQEVEVDPEDPLKVFDKIHDILIFDRRGIGRERTKNESAALNIEIPEGMEEVERIDAKDIIQKKEALQKVQADNDKERNKLDLLKRKEDKIITNIDNKRRTVKDLTSQMEAIQTRIESLGKDIESQRQELTTLDIQIISQKKKIDDLEDPDFGELDKAILEADHINQVVYQRERRDEYRQAAKQKDNEYEGLTKRLSDLADYRKDVIEKADLPIKGLGFDDKGNVTFEDIPIQQRGKSKRILIGLNVCAAINPELKVILVHDGNDLDTDNMGVIYEWAKEMGYQVWLERIKDDGEGVAFEIVEGEVNHGDEPE